MDKSHEVNAFCNGIVVGINLYQQKSCNSTEK